MPERDDDDAMTRQRTLVANAEEMAREHSARREIRLREDRVRHLGSEAAEGAPPPKKPRAVEPRSATADGAPDDEAEKKPRLSDPFPPIGDKRTSTRSDAKKPQVALRQDARATSDEPRRSPTRTTTTPSGSAVDELAVEIEDLLRRTRIAWSAMEAADRVTIVAALGTLVGVFLPWVSAPGRPLSLGIVEGGVVHGALAVAAIALAIGRGRESGGGSLRTVDRAARRASLFHVLLGGLSTFIAVAMLLYWGFVKSPTHPIDVHFGFYWTLAMGTGLSYGGFARFSSRRGH